MAFDIEKFFNRNNVTMREEVVCIEGEMCPSDTIKGVDASGQFDTLSIKRVEEGFRLFGSLFVKQISIQTD